MLTNVDDNKMGFPLFRMRSFTDIPSRKGTGLHVLNITQTGRRYYLEETREEFEAEVSRFSLGLSIWIKWLYPDPLFYPPVYLFNIDLVLIELPTDELPIREGHKKQPPHNLRSATLYTAVLTHNDDRGIANREKVRKDYRIWLRLFIGWQKP